jgi:hypothetical protein
MQRLDTLVRSESPSPPARGGSRDTRGAAAGAMMTPRDIRGAAAGAITTPRDTRGAAVGGSTPRAEVKTALMDALKSNARGASTSASSRYTGTATPNQPREPEKQKRVDTPAVSKRPRSG